MKHCLLCEKELTYQAITNDKVGAGCCGLKYELPMKPAFTQEQLEWVCNRIDDWHSYWRKHLTNKKLNLGHYLVQAKEKLKKEIFKSEF